MKKIAISLLLALLIALCGCSSNANQKEDASVAEASSVVNNEENNTAQDTTNAQQKEQNGAENQSKLPTVQSDADSSTVNFELSTSETATKKNDSEKETNSQQTTALESYELPRIPIK